MKKFFIYIAIAILFCSCIPQKKMEYLKAESGETRTKFPMREQEVKVIQPNDKLFIKILSIDQETKALFGEQSKIGGQADSYLNGFSVSEEGFINFPFIGKLHVAGLSIEDARKKLEDELTQYLPNSAIKLNFLGSTVTILGEVNHPGNFLFFEDRLSIFNAIALASGINSFGDKSTVTIVREQDGVLEYIPVDLTSRNIASTENYYVFPNDILIVNPLKLKYKKLRRAETSNLISIISSTLTLSLIIYNTINLQ